MENVEVALRVLLEIFGGITVLAGGITAIVKLFTPFKELQKKVQEHDKRLEADFKEIKSVKKAVDETNEATKVICRSMLVMLNHEVTGNGVDKIKEQRDAIEQYLINK